MTTWQDCKPILSYTSQTGGSCWASRVSPGACLENGDHLLPSLITCPICLLCSLASKHMPYTQVLQNISSTLSRRQMSKNRWKVSVSSSRVGSYYRWHPETGKTRFLKNIFWKLIDHNQFIRQTYWASKISHFHPSKDLLLSSELPSLFFRFYGLFIVRNRITCTIWNHSF